MQTCLSWCLSLDLVVFFSQAQDVCRADLPVTVPVFGLGGLLGLLLLDCSSSSPDVALQDHLEQREVDVDQAFCQVTSSCTSQAVGHRNEGPEGRGKEKECVD